MSKRRRSAWLGWLVGAIAVALLLGVVAWSLRPRSRPAMRTLPEPAAEFQFSVR